MPIAIECLSFVHLSAVKALLTIWHCLLQTEEGRLPRPHNEEDASKLVKLAEKINEAAKDKAEIDADIVKKFAYTAAGDLSPMAATLGGIVGQEVKLPSPMILLFLQSLCDSPRLLDVLRRFWCLCCLLYLTNP